MASWRGRETALQCRTVEEFRRYLHGLTGGWRPSGMVLHNTASPTLQQWWHGGTAPAQRMANLKNYYQSLGWTAGPHAFVDGVSIWIMTDFNVSGVHSPSWNGTRLGIEMVGDYNVESDEDGAGKKVMTLTTALFGECHSRYGWEPSNDSIKLHKEDPATDHDCPGQNVVKAEFIDDVREYMGEGGDHAPGLPPPERRSVTGIVRGLEPGNYLNIRSGPSGSAQPIGSADEGDKLTVVASAYNGRTRWLRVEFRGGGAEIYGWASAAFVQIESETPPAEVWRENITATVFGGAGDEQESAYGGMVDSSKPGVALPYKWRDGSRPRLIIEGPGGADETQPVDVGPWNTHDPTYVLEGKRPMVEQQYRDRVPAQNGMVPTNDAGIDLTEATAARVGIPGKGKVRWRFI